MPRRHIAAGAFFRPSLQAGAQRPSLRLPHSPPYPVSTVSHRGLCSLSSHHLLTFTSVLRLSSFQNKEAQHFIPAIRWLPLAKNMLRASCPFSETRPPSFPVRRTPARPNLSATRVFLFVFLFGLSAVVLTMVLTW